MLFATIANVIQYRRLAALLLGAWLGASVLADVAVTQNFQTVDRFLQKPGSVSTLTALRDIPRDRERFLLRRNAAEENNWIFLNWERVELILGALLFLLLLFGERPQRLLMAACGAMFLIVAGYAKASANIALAAILIAGGGLIAAKDMFAKKK